MDSVLVFCLYLFSNAVPYKSSSDQSREKTNIMDSA